MPTTIVPPTGPQITDGVITVGRFLQEPTQINRAIERETTERFLSDYMYTQTPASGGAVVYERNTDPKNYGYASDADGRDVEVIDAGGEFPFLSSEEGAQDLAHVKKYGGSFRFSRENIRRDQRDVLARGLRMLSNTVIRKTDRIAVQTLVNDTDLGSLDVTVPWTDADADPVYDILAALSQINDADYGYTATTVLINRAQSLALLGRRDVREQLPRESATLNPVLSPQLGNLLGLDWVVTEAVPAGTLYVTDRNTLGALADEEGGVQTDTYEEKGTQSTIVQAWRTVVPVITDPKAAVRVTGLA